MRHVRPNDGFGCQECGECTKQPPHTECNCEHVPRKPRPDEASVVEELRVTNGLLRELIAALGEDA